MALPVCFLMAPVTPMPPAWTLPMGCPARSSRNKSKPKRAAEDAAGILKPVFSRCSRVYCDEGESSLSHLPIHAVIRPYAPLRAPVCHPTEPDQMESFVDL
eukprot:328746-Chlamydomonas_euryale.AAC.2